MKIKYRVNGQSTEVIAISDRGLQYGDGIFETIAVKNGRLQLWPFHMQRMLLACEKLSLKPVAEAQWLEDINSIGLPVQGIVKLLLSRGTSGRGYAYQDDNAQTRIVSMHPWPDYPQSCQQGVQARICDTPVSVNPVLAGIKHLNRLDNVLARNEWRGADFQEGIMLDHQRNIIEGTMSNIFCVRDNKLYTPSLEYAGVEGVMRNAVLQLAERENISSCIQAINVSEMHSMDDVFFTNSIIGIWPVSQLTRGDEKISFEQQEVTRHLQVALMEYIEKA